MARATNYRIELKLALEQVGMTQAQLARRLGCTPAHISRIVRGHINPNDRDRWRIARALGKTGLAVFPDGAVGEVQPSSNTAETLSATGGQ